MPWLPTLDSVWETYESRRDESGSKQMACSATAADPSVEFDAALIRKYDRRSSRYTSYPAADRFSGTFDYADYLKAAIKQRACNGRAPLSLYLRIPFCRRKKGVTYLDYLKREIDLQGWLFSGRNEVEQLHLGGGAPACLSNRQMDDLLAHVRQRFQFASDAIGEYSIEADPRFVSPERVQTLRSQGFNRISFGVQDFAPQTLEVIAAAREAGFKSIGIDLIYGLPTQHVMSISQTLSKIVEAAPDRIALYNDAHLPNSETRIDMLRLCIKRLTGAGYVYIGMDHFAKPGGDLTTAQRQGRLHRNFQGYSTHAEADLVSCGVSAISAVGASYSQNAKTLNAYYDCIDRNELPVARGLHLSMDDLLRRTVIQMLMCNFELSMHAIELAFPIAFKRHFAAELDALQEMERDGLLTIDDEWITVSLKGRLLIRNVCMVFDRYLQQDIP